MSITLDDLKAGRRAKLKPGEFAQLRGCSEATLSRERWEGSPIAFERDERTGRISYDAQDVLRYLDKPKFKSTSAYQHDGTRRMATARAAKPQHPQQAVRERTKAQSPALAPDFCNYLD